MTKGPPRRVALERVKKVKIRIVGGGALDAPAVKHSVFYLLPANS